MEAVATEAGFLPAIISFLQTSSAIS